MNEPAKSVIEVIQDMNDQLAREGKSTRAEFRLGERDRVELVYDPDKKDGAKTVPILEAFQQRLGEHSLRVLSVALIEEPGFFKGKLETAIRGDKSEDVAALLARISPKERHDVLTEKAVGDKTLLAFAQARHADKSIEVLQAAANEELFCQRVKRQQREVSGKKGEEGYAADAVKSGDNDLPYRVF
jgi:hypothetical protein